MAGEPSSADPVFPSPLVGEGGARAAQPRGRVRGKRRETLPADAIVRARRLRREAGEPEKRLWRRLREALPAARFRRQVPFGSYHVDFCSHSARLIVEVDGDDHAARTRQDAVRTRFLEGEGYRVIRFGNDEVMRNIDGVITVILAATEKGRA